MSDPKNPNESRIVELETIITHRKLEGRPTHWLEDLSWFARMSGYPVGPLSRYDLDLLDVLDAKEKVLRVAREKTPAVGLVLRQRKDKRTFDREFAPAEENYRSRWRGFGGYGYRLYDGTVICANCQRVCELRPQYAGGLPTEAKPRCPSFLICPGETIEHLIARPAFSPLQICEAHTRGILSADQAAKALAIPAAGLATLIARLAGYVPTAGPDSSVLTRIYPRPDLTPADVYSVYREDWWNQKWDRETQSWRGWRQDAKDLLRQAWELARRDVQQWRKARASVKQQVRRIAEERAASLPAKKKWPLRTSRAANITPFSSGLDDEQPPFDLSEYLPPTKPTNEHQGDES